ncbi:tRNA preQ1(34) S-adenosylmethionine ribosyltransferase-isomerase QueA [Picosynechococcus sp. PCC 8807]|uniref:tRNA preQ1(34) S-adenosylmethionine ribosyltransferase-isomerase QueA n=1 Tax=Picosynechococcus sp. PCC 8807 TaxID=195248 RepID=UPI000810D1CA|nr:tRNA preQ1(34) S-adenosylmethionine ribosyltransferase-isomerase QueA [Picosynechococcus sp. PCC 8807]ANV90223.1 tRNA preQ1(34) S-adenosylmethionine ribosyltransferase-isomerase QueA [Picosynechococcus sp. PCC 8807]
MNPDQSLSSYDYDLPPERIAQTPVTPRDRSRLLVLDSADSIQHQHFYHLVDWLQPNDLLVMNNTKVIPARLHGRKTTGAPVEVLLLEERSADTWLALVKPGKRFTLGSEILFTAPHDLSQTLKATVVDRDPETGGRLLEFQLRPNQTLWSVLDDFGEIPFPPYVTDSEAKPDQYQTIYADTPGAVAAPTAGLHFTPEVFAALEAKGIEKTFVTLHVGVGTFRPVEVEDITAHDMHYEWIDVPEETVKKIRETKAKGGRVIAVGTTVVRSLEGMAAASPGELQSFQGQTNLFIYPGYEWQVVDGLITNFHLPKSSLLMLVSALIGRERLLDVYQVAIAQEYRFYSFGDAMLILPEAKVF